MGIITKIEQQKNKNRVNIFIDGSFFCGLFTETAVLFGLKVGKVIDENKINEAIRESEQKRAFEKSLDYLSDRLHSKRELTNKLLKKGFDKNSIDGAINKLEEYGYINDSTFAKSYISQNSKYSKAQLKAKLISKGIDRGIIDYNLSEFFNEDSEFELCKQQAVKYLKSKKSGEKNLKQKLTASLARKGFSFDNIKKTIKELFLYDDFE